MLKETESKFEIGKSHREQEEGEESASQRQLNQAVEAEKAKLQEDFRLRQEAMDAKWASERARYEERLEEMQCIMSKAHERVSKMVEHLQRPIHDRETKLQLVNGLQLKIHQTDLILLAGTKGMGKSTFLWLLGKGEKPKRSLSDGTVEIRYVDSFIDFIGLRGWTQEELLKLMVLMIYEGIPADLIVFGNDRIDLPAIALGSLGINNPMIVIMSSHFWKLYEPPSGAQKRIHLVETRDGVRLVEPEADLEFIYSLPVYEDIKKFHLGTPITHHENLELLIRRRKNVGIRPFQFLLDKLGDTFTVGMENDSIMEALFRFIYIFEKKYGKNRLSFMNYATLQDFS
ncbi:uncharacterized protein LOC129599613 [Paramacrobiotus metropolitanus]|uniref:uncharacterized protein LOC129599613 n=1 Tax=Paramacrobiotus metropolitanus TaxID=2943436 RepID=UPI0024457B65|nr:uncharacterized protein LOC129599613 [Paramacrobiotus metropolitanus]